MSLFDSGEKKNLVTHAKTSVMPGASGRIATNVKLQYLCTIINGEALHQFDTFCAQFGNTIMAHLNQFILGLGT